jgi:hypothetical protein
MDAHKRRHDGNVGTRVRIGMETRTARGIGVDLVMVMD